MTMIQDKSGPVLGYRAVAILLTGLYLLQAFLAGQFIDGDSESLKDLHGVLGDSLVLIAVLLTVLVFLARRTFGIGLVTHCATMAVLTLVQVVLGRSGGGQLEWHIPLGVLLFGMACGAVMLGFFDLKAQRRIS